MSIWARKYVAGFITGFTACTTGYAAGGGLSSFLAAASIVTISALWYYTGKGDARSEHAQDLKRILTKGAEW